MKRSYSLIPILFLALSFFSATPADDCLELLNKVYKKMVGLYNDKGDTDGLYMRYNVEIINLDNQHYNDEIEVKSNSKKAVFTSGKVTIYQDASTMVAIQPEAKTIFITRPLPSDFRKKQLEGVHIMHDSLLKWMELKKCVKDDVGKQNRSCKKLSFEVKVGNLQKVGMTGVTYWINEKELQVIKMRIDYDENSGKPVKSSSYTIEKFDSKYSGLPFAGSAVNMVITADKKLKPAFRGYTLVDKR